MAQQPLDSRMAALGFTRATEETGVAHRLVISLSGREKQGKSHFSLTAPPTIALFDFDTGLEGVLKKFAGDKKIWYNDYRRLGNTLNQTEYEGMWTKFARQYLGVLALPEVKTIIWDTATEVWELLRLARFGQLTQVMPFQYGPVNAEFRELVRKIYDTDKSLVLLHKMKKRYRNDKWDGGYERAGFNDMGFQVQVNATISRDEDGEFIMSAQDCRQNSAVAGQEFPGPMCDFTFLAMAVFPGTGPDDWK